MLNPLRKTAMLLCTLATTALMFVAPITAYASNTARWNQPPQNWQAMHNPADGQWGHQHNWGYMAPTYNFESTFPVDQWGRPTTSNVVADREQNIRRDRHSAHLPPSHGVTSGFYSGVFPTNRVNPFAPIQNNNPGASHALAAEEGFMALNSGDFGANVRSDASHSGGFLAPTSITGNSAGNGHGGVAGSSANNNVAVGTPQGSGEGGITVTHRPIAPQARSNATLQTHQSIAGRITEVTPFADGTIGIIRIPALNNRQAAVRPGVELSTLDNYIGHFTNTSQWDGNVALASHNRGRGSFFAGIWTLLDGDRIYFETTAGIRAYEVVSIEQISETDMGVLSHTHENTLTLITCVYNRPNLRWRISAIQVS
jgi:sortase A